ncbi:MAG: chromate efflux transporter [Acidobacteria bacterium]|nr:chromate efflux transporter [Acidobacteriota bacterium]
MSTTGDAHAASLTVVLREWSRLGLTGFGGPPAHISLLRALCVDTHGWIDEEEFEHALAATNLLPGPASTQMAIYCAWRARGVAGALVGGLCFIVPGLVIIIALAALFLDSTAPTWIVGMALGAGAAVPAVALRTAHQLADTSWRRITASGSTRRRWFTYLVAGIGSSLLLPSLIVAAIIGTGLFEVIVRTRAPRHSRAALFTALGPAHLIGAGAGALAWVALKIGALSYGGGFVIVPLMQHDVVATYHWMTGAQFLNAVALGQVTPGPVVLSIAVVGFAAKGIAGALLAAGIAFSPSFMIVMIGGPHFDRLRSNTRATAFLAGAAPCVIGAIGASSVSLGLLLERGWQVLILAAALAWLFVARKSPLTALLISGGAGGLISLWWH